MINGKIEVFCLRLHSWPTQLRSTGMTGFTKMFLFVSLHCQILVELKNNLLSKCDTEKLFRQQTHKNLCGTTMVIPQNVNTQFTKINSCSIKQLFHGLDIMTSWTTALFHSWLRTNQLFTRQDCFVELYWMDLVETFTFLNWQTKIIKLTSVYFFSSCWDKCWQGRVNILKSVQLLSEIHDKFNPKHRIENPETVQIVCIVFTYQHSPIQLEYRHIPHTKLRVSPYFLIFSKNAFKINFKHVWVNW